MAPRIFAALGDPNDKRAVSLIRKRVGACLFHLKAKDLARNVPTGGPYKGWVAG